MTMAAAQPCEVTPDKSENPFSPFRGCIGRARDFNFIESNNNDVAHNRVDYVRASRACTSASHNLCEEEEEEDSI